MAMRAIAVVVSVSVASCGSCGTSEDEVRRVVSPDRQVEAIVIEGNGGATTSFWYNVHVATKGTSPGTRVARFYGAVRSRSAYGVNARWLSNDALLIEYLDARSAELIVREARIGTRIVSVTTRSGVEDPSAPPGGMLYNLHRPGR